MVWFTYDVDVMMSFGDRPKPNRSKNDNKSTTIAAIA